MPTAVDPVRRTLDTLALDPAAANDRPYLESMLRRLGYSETEIRAALHGAPAPAPAASKAAPAPTDGDDRIIEVEYTGPGIQEFMIVVGVDQSELGDALGLGTGMEAGTEVFEGGPSMEEVDRLVADGDLSDFDDWGEGALKEDAAGEGEGAEAPPTAEELMDGTAAGGKIGGEEVAAPGDGGADFKGTAPQAIDFQTGEPLVEFHPSHLNEAVIDPIDPAAEAEKLRADGWAVADPVTDQFPPEGVDPETWEAGEAMATQAAASGLPAHEGPAGETVPEGQTWEAKEHGFQYGDWMLYKRDEMKGDQPQRVYFFSKGAPEGSDQAPLPDGYDVAENPDTGRPFLRRSGSASSFEPEGIDAAHPRADPRTANQPKKRVRILRVRAATREEAIAKLQAEGRHVIASMPIDIEKKLR